MIFLRFASLPTAVLRVSQSPRTYVPTFCDADYERDDTSDPRTKLITAHLAYSTPQVARSSPEICSSSAMRHHRLIFIERCGRWSASLRRTPAALFASDLSLGLRRTCGLVVVANF